MPHEVLLRKICLSQTNTIDDAGNYSPQNELSVGLELRQWAA